MFNNQNAINTLADFMKQSSDYNNSTEFKHHLKIDNKIYPLTVSFDLIDFDPETNPTMDKKPHFLIQIGTGNEKESVDTKPIH